jgi:hypothetical protein
MRAGATLLFVAAAASFPLACSSFGSSATPPAAGDAAAEAASDAATDAAVDADAGPAGPFCATLAPKPVFCNDFDEGSLGTGWTGADVVSDYGTTALDDIAFSPPHSLLARVELTDAGLCGYERLVYRTKGALTVARLAFDVRVGDGKGGARYGNIAQLVLGNTDEARTFYIDLGVAVHSVHEQKVDHVGQTTTDAFHDFGGDVTADGWHHLEMVLDYGAAPPTVTVILDGAPSVQSLTWGAIAGVVDLQVAAGTSCYGGGAAFEMRIDDVVFDFH